MDTIIYRLNGFDTLEFNPPLSQDVADEITNEMFKVTHDYPNVSEFSQGAEAGYSAFSYTTKSEISITDRASCAKSTLGRLGVESEFKIVPELTARKYWAHEYAGSAVALSHAQQQASLAEVGSA